MKRRPKAAPKAPPKPQPNPLWRRIEARNSACGRYHEVDLSALGYVLELYRQCGVDPDAQPRECP